jgi:hypothetical protein
MQNLEIREDFSLSRRFFLLIIPRLDVFLRPHSPVRAVVFSSRYQDQDQTVHGIGSNTIPTRCIESLEAIFTFAN